MYKYKCNVTISGSVMRPAYQYSETVWVLYPEQIRHAVYDNLKDHGLYGIARDQVHITNPEYVDMID